MADTAGAITIGYERVFGKETTKLMCYVHVGRAIDRWKIGNSDLKPEIKSNLSQLRLAYNEKVFKAGCELFLVKWKEKHMEFAVYFEKVWLGKNRNWYNGAGFRVPHTNNALEGFNGKIKTHHTYY